MNASNARIPLRIGLLVWLALCSVTDAFAASLTVSPAMGGTHTVVSVQAAGLSVATTYTLEFVGSPATSITTLSSDGRGSISTKVSLPALPAGAGKMRLKTTGLGGSVVAYTVFTSLSSISFTPQATGIHAGQSLPYTIDGLSSGSLTVLYEGQAVVGPLAVSSGSYHGKFVVPTDRPGSLPANANITVLNKAGKIVIGELDTTVPVLPKFGSPFQIGITQPPPTQLRHGQHFDVTGQFAVNENEAPPEQVSLWFFGDNGQVFPLGAAQATVAGNQYQYSLSGNAAGGLSMTASPGGSGALSLNAPSHNAFGMPTAVVAADTHIDPLPDDHWQIRVHVTKQNGQPIAGALVQFDGATLVEDTNTGSTGGGYQLHSILDYVVAAAAPTQYQYMRSTDSRGCPLVLSRKLTDANGDARFEFLDEDLVMAQAPFPGEVDAGGTIGHGQPRELRLAIDASAQGYGFQFDSGPAAGQFLPHIYLVRFEGAGDGDPAGDTIVFTDYYQNVVVQTGTRNTSFPLSLPTIQPMVGLYDTSIVPWIAKKGPLVIDSGSQSNATNRLIFGPVYSELGITNPAWVRERSGEGFPTTIAVRTDPAVTGVVSSAKLYLDMNRDGAVDFMSNFSASANPVDCSIDGLNDSITWRANLPDIRQQPSGQIKGYVEFIGSPNSGSARQYIGIDMLQQDVAWLGDLDEHGAGKYTDRQVEFSAGGQRIGIHAIENTADTSVQLDHDPPAEYKIGRLKNSTDNTRLLDMFFNNTGQNLISAPLDGAHKEAGHNGSPTVVEHPHDVGFHEKHLKLIDQSFPLFYYVWGVPILAGVEIGANFTLLAEIDVQGKYVMKNLEPQLTVTTTPSLDLGLDFYVDLDVLFDLVDGGVDLNAVFGLDMPISVDPSRNPEVVVDDCFSTFLKLSWHFEVFCPPLDLLCDAFNDIEGQKTLLSEKDGSGCANRPATLLADAADRSAIIVPKHTAVAYSHSGAGILAFTRDASRGTEPPVLVVRPVDGGDYGRLADETVLSTAPGIRSVDVEFYQDDKAVIVWAESDSDYATLARLPASQRLPHQRLMYATFDGEIWSAKAALTAAHGGEGGVDLAACTTDPGTVCPPKGEVLAVWTRDMAGDITQHRTRVYSSRFSPARGWTTPMPVDANTVLDSSPSAAYVDASPVVAFVRSSSGDFADTDARRVAYRFLDSSSNAVQVPAELPGGVAWPSIVGLGNGKFAIAHTHVDDPQHAFVGNSQRVALAYGNACAAGVCAIAAQPLTDANGRPIYGEHPTALVDEDSHVTVVMRGMGFGTGLDGNNRQPSDPIGMALHTGELIWFAVDAQGEVVVPVSISNDGAGHFAPKAAYDFALGQVVAVSTQGVQIPDALRAKFLASGATPKIARAKGLSADPDVLVFGAEQGVDLALESVTTTATSLHAGDSFSAHVLVRNAGIHYGAGLNGYQVRMSWDAPYDAGGVSVGARLIPSLDAGQDATLNISVSVPAGYAPDQAHRLYATIFRDASTIDDVQGGNDQAFLDFGGMPMPFALNATAIGKTSLVQLTWDPVEDPQHLIAGYRIWCHDGDAVWRHLGSSFVAGFLDVTAPIDSARHYQVTSYSRNAIESPPSSEAVSVIEPPSDRLFANGFE